MLAVILKILSILGMLLLILLGILLFVLLLVLFMPIVYQADADKSETELKANVRIRWLFGFLRVDYHYPEPGRMIVKLLWKTLYDSGNPPAKKTSPETGREASTEDQTTENKTEETKTIEKKEADHPTENTDEATTEKSEAEQLSESIEEEKQTQTFFEKLFAKYEKIKYTIQQFCDKIKHIWDNITFYKKLLQDEQTKLLLSHVLTRIGKILRHIRPRKLKADVTFGADSPDTTGYAYGVYCMFIPQLGKNVFVTPDFERKIFVGTIHVAGHITVFTLLVNILAVLLDKRLRLLIKRLKNHAA